MCTSHTCHLIHKTGVWGSPHWLTASYATLHAATSYPIKTYNLSSDSASHLHTLARTAASKTHLVLSHTLVDVVGIANESARDSLYFQSCRFRHIAMESPCVRISISLTCVLVSLQWATDGSPLLSESKKRNIRVKGKQSKEKAEGWGWLWGWGGGVR